LLVDRVAVDVFHDQRRLDDRAEQALAAGLEVEAASQGGVAELLADVVLVLDLLDVADVLLGLADDVLERVELVGLAVGDRVDRAGGALADAFDDLVAEQLFGQLRAPRRVVVLRDRNRRPPPRLRLRLRLSLRTAAADSSASPVNSARAAFT
jgi:hypothetical protein